MKVFDRREGRGTLNAVWAHTAISWNKKETRSIPVTLLPINQMMQNEELGVILRRLHSHGLQEMTTRTKHCFVQVDVKSPVHRNMAEKPRLGTNNGSSKYLDSI